MVKLNANKTQIVKENKQNAQNTTWMAVIAISLAIIAIISIVSLIGAYKGTGVGSASKSMTGMAGYVLRTERGEVRRENAQQQSQVQKFVDNLVRTHRFSWDEVERLGLHLVYIPRDGGELRIMTHSGNYGPVYKITCSCFPKNGDCALVVSNLGDGIGIAKCEDKGCGDRGDSECILDRECLGFNMGAEMQNYFTAAETGDILNIEGSEVEITTRNGHAIVMKDNGVGGIFECAGTCTYEDPNTHKEKQEECRVLTHRDSLTCYCSSPGASKANCGWKAPSKSIGVDTPIE